MFLSEEPAQIVNQGKAAAEKPSPLSPVGKGSCSWPTFAQERGKTFENANINSFIFLSLLPELTMWNPPKKTKRKEKKKKKKKNPLHEPSLPGLTGCERFSPNFCSDHVRLAERGHGLGQADASIFRGVVTSHECHLAGRRLPNTAQPLGGEKITHSSHSWPV